MPEADPSAQDFRDLMLGEEPGLEEVMTCVFGIQSHE
ncbi:TrmB family transcriptional regulator, partial [Halobacteriales archaeon QH_2_65_14]